MSYISEEIMQLLHERAHELLSDDHEASQVIEDMCSEYPDVNPRLIEQIVGDQVDYEVSTPGTDNDAMETPAVTDED